MFNLKKHIYEKSINDHRTGSFCLCSQRHQVVIGSNIRIAHGGTSNGDFNDEASTNMSIKPKVGYWLNEKMQVGMQFGLDYAYTRDYSGTDNAKYESATSTSWQFTPYFRYNLANWKSFTVFYARGTAPGLSITPKSSWMRNYAPRSGEEALAPLTWGWLCCRPELPLSPTTFRSLLSRQPAGVMCCNYASYTTTSFMTGQKAPLTAATTGVS